MNTEILEQEVVEALDTVFELPNIRRARCHEIARLLKSQLTMQGHSSVEVNDGVVSYDVDFLLEMYDRYLDFSGTIELGEKPFVRTPVNSWTKRIAHSWCELGEIVIDYHHVIEATPHHTFENLLIIDPKENLVGKANYLPNGKSVTMFGTTFIYIPYMLTQLRV